MSEPSWARYRYRRQFIFGPRPVSIEGEWNSHRVSSSVLTIQRDLPLHAAKSADGAELRLLGFIIDPEFPELTDEQILTQIAKSNSWDEVVAATLNLSGRFVLFHVKDSNVRVLNDPTGLRTVYYAVAADEPWCFSQPGLYRHVRNLEYSRASLEFIGRRECRKDFEVIWPATSSPYQEVAALLPNHYLDLTNQRPVRFWPANQLEPVSTEDGITEGSRLLRNSMLAITARGKVGFAITGGRDSRSLLALSRSVLKNLWPYLCQHGELTMESPDLWIGKEVCAIAGIERHVIPCPQRMSKHFREVFMRNHDPAHVVWGRFSEGMVTSYPQELISISGNVVGTGRCSYWPSGVHPDSVSVADVIRVTKHPDCELTRRHYGDWLREAAPLAKLGHKTLDLLCWEHHECKWLGTSQTEFDIARDSFTPYSNRRILTTLQGMPAIDRIKPAVVFWREVIRRAWPELLAFPFNPRQKASARWAHKLRKAKGQALSLFGHRPLSVALEWPRPPVDKHSVV